MIHILCGVTNMLIGKYLNEIRADPYFFLILLGAVVWYIGLLIPFLGTPAVTLGFTLTCFATTAYALKRPTELALPGVIVGIIIHFIGLWAIGIIPIIGPGVYVLGHVLILFFAVPLAIRRE